MADYQDDFTAALLDPARPAPMGVIRPDGTQAVKRFNVYRNNVVVSLSEALADAFPVVRTLVGEEFFRAMAGVHVRAHPPKSPLMMFYGADFPAFLERFEPARGLPYLPDVARLELARRRAYHAADDPVADPAPLGTMNEDALLGLRVTFQAASLVIRSAHPIFSIWRYNSTEDKSPVRPGAEDVLVSRPVDMVEMRTLPPGGAAFLEALKARATLGDAAARALESAPDFDLGQNLGGMFAARIVAAFHQQED